MTPDELVAWYAHRKYAEEWAKQWLDDQPKKKDGSPMGTSIHMFLEKQNRDGSWSCPGLHWYSDTEDRNMPWQERGRLRKGWYKDLIAYPHDEPGDDRPRPICRNYALFGILAGLSCWPTEGPVAPPRGIPEDLAPELRRVDDLTADWDYHTHSWLLLSEVLAYPWDKPSLLGEATISEKRYNRWLKERGGAGDPYWDLGPCPPCPKTEAEQKTKKGKAYAVWMTEYIGFFRDRYPEGLMLRLREQGLWEKLRDSGNQDPDRRKYPDEKQTGIQIKYYKTARECVEDNGREGFLSLFVPIAKRLHRNPDKVRLTFSFDN